MFILITQARVDFIDNICQHSNYKNEEIKQENASDEILNIQSFAEAALILFNNFDIDQENLIKHIEHIVKILTIEYLEKMKILQKHSKFNNSIMKLISEDF